MATARTALQGLLTQITPPGGWAALTPPVRAGILWPSEPTIQDVCKAKYNLVCVADVGDGARNATRWAGQTMGLLDVVPPAPGVTAALSHSTLAPSGTLTITLSGTPAANDAVVFSAQPAVPVFGGVGASLANAIAVASESLATLATALAASISAATLDLSASATGAVVTVTAASDTPFCVCTANTGNIGSRGPEVKRMARAVRVCLWTHTEADREAVGNPIDVAVGILDNIGGFYLSPASPGPLGDWVHVHSIGDAYVEEQLGDIYRWDFRVMLEYGTLAIETLYPVLGTSLTFSPETANLST